MFRVLIFVFGFLASFFTTDPGGDAAPEPTNAPPAVPEPAPENTRYTEADVERLVNERIAKREQQATAAAEREKKQKQEAELKQKEDWKKVAEGKDGEITTLQEQITTLQQQLHNERRARVAAKHKLPEELAQRLTGDDEAALEADAKKLAALVAPPKAPETETGGGQRPPTPPSTPPANGQQRYRFSGPNDIAW